MNSDLNVKILESYVEIDKVHDEINNKIFKIITQASELVELSDDDYQIERTLKLNKISLKGYVLDSECCVQLNDNNVTDYSIEDLKKFLEEYEKLFNVDYSKYFLALSLYENIEEIENLIDSKISLELIELNNLIPNIDDIKVIDKSNLEKLYYQQKNTIDNFYHSSKIEEKSYNICIQFLNDIFNYYISGYPDIPDEYLYHDE
jgi:hypothetical protein